MSKPASVGITVAAAIALAGSALTTIGGLAFVLLVVLLPKFDTAARPTPFVAAFLFFDAFLLLAFGGWGIASAVGLFELKNWARTSTIVFAVILLVFSLPSAVLMAVIPLDSANDPDLPPHFLLIFRLVFVSIELALTGLAVFWLVYFNRRSVRSQFTPQMATAFPPQTYFTAASGLPPQGAVSFPLPSPAQRVRPLSITVIAWVQLVGAAFLPINLMLNHFVFHAPHQPVPFLCFLLFDRAALAYFLSISIVQAVSAVAMLKLKPWGLHTTIGMMVLHLANGLLVLAIPSLRLRYQQVIEANLSAVRSNFPHPHAQPAHLLPLWAGLVVGLGIAALLLAFLLWSRQAFLSGCRPLDEGRS